MIADAIMGMLYKVLSAVIGWLPDMPDAAVASSDELYNLLNSVGYFIPLGTIAGILALSAAVFAGFMIFRIIRMFTPGG